MAGAVTAPGARARPPTARRWRRAAGAAVLAAAALAGAGGCSWGDGAGAGGRLEVADAWAAENETVAAVYLTIDNGGEADRLVGAETGVAGDVSVMDHGGADPSAHGTPDGDDGDGVDLAVPPGPTELAPGGRHVMLTGLTRPLRPGDRIPLTLEFERAGTRSVDVEILTWDAVVDRSPPTPDGGR